MSSGSAEKKLILRSMDGETFELEETVAVASMTIKHMLELDCVHTMVPLPNVTSMTLAKAIEYCKRHAEAKSQKKDDEMWEDELRRWDLDFVAVGEETLVDLIMAADYLNIESLLDLTCGYGKLKFPNASIEKKITLKSSDGKTFEVDETVAVESQTIKHMVEDDCANTVIPLLNVTSTILSKVIEYCKKHVDSRGEKKDDKASEDDLKNWDADFVKVD